VNKKLALQEVRECAREYFADRDKLALSKEHMLDRMLVASETYGATQAEIAAAASFDVPEGWRFHRTRIQQYLRDARIARRMRHGA